MVKNNFNNLSHEYLDIDYNIATNKLKEAQIFKCANCGKDINIQYDEDNNPVSLWCNKCRELEFTIKKKFKMKNGSKNIKNKKDPYMALAQMKILIEKSKPYWKGNKFMPISADKMAGYDSKSYILSEIYDILKKAKVPEKYLIAESLD